MKQFKNTMLVASLAATLVTVGVHSQAHAAPATEAPKSEVTETVKKEQAMDLYLGDKALFSLKSQADYDQLIQKLQNHFKTQGAQLVNMTVEPEISARPATDDGNIVSVDEAFKVITEGGRQEAVYVADKTESLESIASRFNMSMEEIKSLNPNWEDPVTRGSKIKVYGKAPLIGVKTEEILTNATELPFNTVTKEDPNMLKTERKVEQKGVNAQMETRVRIQKQNGRTVSSITEGSRLTREAVTEIVTVGTKESLATGKFINPTTGRLTSGFGPRWGRFHYGIDIANRIGTGINAADGGVVTKAGPAGTYGNLVIIDHQNGYTTRYAHLSRVDVKVGQTVKQGEHIAKMGSTGRSTGSHLHFEVRVNGKAQNPRNYVNY